jgi:hypothetical protein
MNGKSYLVSFLAVLALLLSAGGATAQDSVLAPQNVSALAVLGTGFTYQGQLKQGGSAVNATCDFQFSLHDDASAGAQVGSTHTLGGVDVVNGLFTVTLNSGGEFGGSAFDGDARWLQVAVRCPAGSGSYTTLSPRQALTPAPYTLYADNANNANNANLLDGQDSTAFAAASHTHPGSEYENVVIVAQSGGDFTSIQSALNSITDNSAANPYLVWVAPGTYTETVTMKQYVDIEGAGELLTKITFTGSAATNTGTVVGASNAELRFLSVENTGGAAYATAIYNTTASPRITDVTVSASGGTIANTGVRNDLASQPTLTNVTVSLSGGNQNHGVTSVDSIPTLINVDVSVDGGLILNRAISNDGLSVVTIRNSVIHASGILANAIFNNTPATFTRVAASMVDGASSGGITTCAGVYDASFTFFASACP